MSRDRFQRRIDRLLVQIEEAADERAWQKVRQLAMDVLLTDPGNPDAIRFLAAANRAAGGVDTTHSESPALLSATSHALLEQPTPFANGRYQVKRFPGEGGKKKVYLANDTLL